MSRSKKHICCSLRATDGTEFTARVSPDIDQRTIDLIGEVLKSAHKYYENKQLEERRMTKLVAEQGKIKKLDVFKADTFSVAFRRAAISPAGDFGEVRITTTGEGSESEGEREFSLTFAQAVSLAKEILKRCQER